MPRCPNCRVKISLEKSNVLHLKVMLGKEIKEFKLDNFREGCDWCGADFDKIFMQLKIDIANNCK